MLYESSYEGGRLPFTPDTKRGYWANPQDFIFLALSVAFRADIFIWHRSSQIGALSFLIIYTLCLALFIVPLIVIQSFLGQFSSSGFISAFRVSPLFKGIGYVSLALNICVVAYFSTFAMVPLLYMFASMNPTLPWSCEGFKTWATNLTEREEENLCNMSLAGDALEGSDYDSDNITSYYDYIPYIPHIPSVLYFTKIFNEVDLLFDYKVDFEMSWQLIICALLMWSIIALVMYKFFDTEMFGTMVRYCVWIILGILCLVLVRFSFLPGAKKVFYYNFIPSWHHLEDSLAVIPFYSISAFGPGWGLLISLSSYNKFKTNIIRSSWVIGLGQMFITFAFGLLNDFSKKYFNEITDDNYYSQTNHMWIIFLSSGSVMAHMEWANMWSILFYFMLFLAAMLMILVQLKSILTTIYDEFVYLREKKLQVSLSLLGFCTACSLYFTSNHGLSFITALTADVGITQNSINLLLILIVLWIYGRMRFQRDFIFMTNQHFSTWFVYILRFIAPCCFLLGLFASIMISFYIHVYANISIGIIAVIFIGLPWLCIPGYAIYQIRLGIGSITTRFIRCCRPNDWFPVEVVYRQEYDEVMNNAEITQTLGESGDLE